MIIAESTAQMRKEKKRLLTMMRVYRISRRDVSLKCSYHYNTVRKAMDPDDIYWNQDVINLVEQMIEEKKNPVPQEQSL